MHEVLLVYKQSEMQFDGAGKLIVPDNWVMTHTISYDEKPGIQAIAETPPDLRPDTENGEIYRDHEYKRLGTISLPASIDLNTGKTVPLVSNSHKSSDFIEFLKILDREYPEQIPFELYSIIILHINLRKQKVSLLQCLNTVLNLYLLQHMVRG